MKFIDRIVNKFEQKLICMLRTLRTWNSTIRFSKFTLKKEIYGKFEEFFSKLVWRETLFSVDYNMLLCILPYHNWTEITK